MNRSYDQGGGIFFMNILLVEDNPGDVLIIDEMLKNVVGTEFNLVILID